MPTPNATKRISFSSDEIVRPRQPTQEELEARRGRHTALILEGGAMRAVVSALIERNESMEIDAGSHVITISVIEK